MVGEEEEEEHNTKILGKKKKYTLPKRGEKSFKPTPQAEESLKIKYTQWAKVVEDSTHRVQKMKTLAKAQWNAQERAVHVTQPKGKQLESVGNRVKGKLLLYPEEAMWDIVFILSMTREASWQTQQHWRCASMSCPLPSARCTGCWHGRAGATPCYTTWHMLT